MFSKFLHATALLYPSQVSSPSLNLPQPPIHLRATWDVSTAAARRPATCAGGPVWTRRLPGRDALPARAACIQRARHGVRGAASGEGSVLRLRVEGFGVPASPPALQ